MLDWVFWSLLLYGASAVGAVHALLYKRDSRAATLWIVTCFGLPWVGPLLYLVLGVNRVRRRARQLRADGDDAPGTGLLGRDRSGPDPSEHANLPREYHLLAKIADRVTRRPLLAANQVTPLFDGEAAYPRMLEAIEAAQSTVRLSSYIFRLDTVGKRFVDTLVAARARGVSVHVILDGVGQWYSFARTGRSLELGDVRVARFLPLSLRGVQLHFNLRNHRKILVVDGEVGFTGGMNIGDQHMVASSVRRTGVHDVHYEVRGAVVPQLDDVFCDDWEYCTGERLASSSAVPVGHGAERCRGIASGPDDDVEKLNWILIGALSSAVRRIRIMTPYFLPPRELLSALRAAALRDVEVEVVIPSRSNLAFVDWATRSMLWEVLEFGGRVFYTPAPFHHTKLLVIDDGYVVLGSSNLDARSLRLNFELDLEVYGAEFAAVMIEHFEGIRSDSHEVTIAELDARPFLARVRDATVWLFSPYL